MDTSIEILDADDARAVTFADVAVRVFIDATREAFLAKDETLATIFLGLAFDVGCELYGMDVWTARMEQEFPADWGLRIPYRGN